MLRSTAIDGFSLAYERAGSGPPVVLLHGWPGMRTDYRALVSGETEVVVPGLRGFGDSDTPEAFAAAIVELARGRTA